MGKLNRHFHIRKLQKLPWTIFQTTVFLVLLSSIALGQSSRTLNIGRLSYTSNEAMSADDIQWPAGSNYLDLSMMDTYGVYVGTQMNWTDQVGGDHTVKVAMVAEHKYSDFENVTPFVEGAFQRTFRNPFPTKLFDGNAWNTQFEINDPVDATIPADAQLYHHIKGFNGIDWERWTYAFADREKENIIITEYVFTNTSGEVRPDVFIGLSGAMNSDAHYPADLWGNYYGATYAQYAGGDMAADSLRFWYGWDADETSAFPNVDTRGKPESIWGYFQEPQSMGYVVLHADASVDDESDDPAQPFKGGWSYRQRSPDLNVNTHEEVYAFLSGPWNDVEGQAYSKFLDSNGNEHSLGDPGANYRVLADGWTEHGFDPTTEQSKTFLFGFGPYQMQPGDDVRIVMAFVGGMIPQRLAIDAGRAYVNGYDAQRSDLSQPLPYDVYDNPADPYSPAFAGQTPIAAEGTYPISQAQKDAILDLSKKRAFMEAGKAVSLWNNGSNSVNKGAGTFGIPLAPASPSLTVTSENQQIHLEWGEEAVQDTRGGTVVGYKIYRNYWRPPSVTEPTDTTFVLVDSVGPDVREYVDTGVIVGEQYWYYVTAVNGDGLESSAYQNRMGRSATPDREAASPTRPPHTSWEQEVVVVPNPYHTVAAQKYSGRRLNFLNLPPYANIRIYTMTGDHVQTIEHNSGDGDEEWLRQDTFSTMQIVSGIYVYVVEELDGAGGSPTGKKAIGKFVVIK